MSATHSIFLRGDVIEPASLASGCGAGISDDGSYDATTTPPVTDIWEGAVQLVGGVFNLDLTAAPARTVKDFTGLKVRQICVQTDATNTAKVAVTAGASNGYPLFGATAGRGVDIGDATTPDSETFLAAFKDDLPAISATEKVISFSSSQADAKFNVIISVG